MIVNNVNNYRVSVIGLGYVGLPLVYEFSKKFPTIGFDIDQVRVTELKRGVDRTYEINNNKLNRLKKLNFTSNEYDIEKSNVYIITVPTPVDKNNKPDLKPLISASELVGKVLKKNDIVVYESTVFPGCTEEICVPILEKYSNFIYNKDFFCGYSPERINPGDKIHTLTKIKKIVSGSNPQTTDRVEYLYNSIIKAGTFKASSITVAEAAKVIENTQRDVNIALINELALIFNKLGINTKEVLDAACSKWNFLNFRPGLVGGHCIGVDPYYLTFKAQEIGYHPEMILAGRKINDSMGEYIARNTVAELTKKNINPIGAKIGIFGLTFKENCPDLRNTKVISVINHLKLHNCKTYVVDSWANVKDAKKKFGIDLIDLEEIKNLDALILSVAHDEFKKFTFMDWEKMLKPNGILVDIKSIYNKDLFQETNMTYWSL